LWGIILDSRGHGNDGNKKDKMTGEKAWIPVVTGMTEGKRQSDGGEKDWIPVVTGMTGRRKTE